MTWDKAVASTAASLTSAPPGFSFKYDKIRCWWRTRKHWGYFKTLGTVAYKARGKKKRLVWSKRGGLHVCMSNGVERGDGGNGQGMSESQRRGKNENKKAKKWFMPTEQRWRGVFLFFIYIIAFSFGSQTHWLRGGDRGTEGRVCSLCPTHTNTQRDHRTLKQQKSSGCWRCGPIW